MFQNVHFKFIGLVVHITWIYLKKLPFIYIFIFTKYLFIINSTLQLYMHHNCKKKTMINNNLLSKNINQASLDHSKYTLFMQH